jgi:hypothetical protein
MNSLAFICPLVLVLQTTICLESMQYIKASANNLIKSRPLFKFGIIADIQYIDAPNGKNFHGNKIRRYRQSLNIFKKAVSSWNSLLEVIMHKIHIVNVLLYFN